MLLHNWFAREEPRTQRKSCHSPCRKTIWSTWFKFMWTDRAVTYILVDSRGKIANVMIAYGVIKKYKAVYLETRASVHTDAQIVVVSWSADSFSATGFFWPSSRRSEFISHAFSSFCDWQQKRQIWKTLKNNSMGMWCARLFLVNEPSQTKLYHATSSAFFKLDGVVFLQFLGRLMRML